jgi:hypothetical protein
LMNFFSLDIFEMIANINELTKELLIENCWFLRDFKRMSKKLSALSNGGQNMNPFSPLLVFLLGRCWELLDHK